MSRFVLQPGRLLQGHFAVDHTKDPVEVTFQELVAEMLPVRNAVEGRKLLALKHGCFIGQTMSSKNPRQRNLFVFYGVNGSGDMTKYLQADPTLEARFLRIYRVEEAEYDSQFTDMTPATPEALP